MRIMLKASLCTEKANAAVRAGTLGKTIQAILGDLKPEAAYFTDSGGKRTGYMICDLADASQIPAIAEPWFLAFDAAVEIHIVMLPEDLGKAADQMAGVAAKYGK